LPEKSFRSDRAGRGVVSGTKVVNETFQQVGIPVA